MLRNLKAEMVRHGVTVDDIYPVIEKTKRTTAYKIDGKYDFTMPEAITIRNKFFPGMTLEYLFTQNSAEK